MASNQSITLIDYGAGNLLNVQRAFEYLGVKTELAKTPDEIQQATKLVLPGVGAFPAAMEALETQSLTQAIQDYTQTERPLLGICLGMQLLFEQSDEFQLTSGLGIIPGHVTRLPEEAIDQQALTIPSMGWQSLQLTEQGKVSPLLKNQANTDCYFVHSFHCQTDDPSFNLATYERGGHSILAAVQKNNIIGLQFHPEKSASKGLEILQAFINLEQ